MFLTDTLLNVKAVFNVKFILHLVKLFLHLENTNNLKSYKDENKTFTSRKI